MVMESYELDYSLSALSHVIRTSRFAVFAGNRKQIPDSIEATIKHP